MNDQLIMPEFCVGHLGDHNIDYHEFIQKYETERKSCLGCLARDYCYLGNFGELYKIDPTLNSEFPTCNVLRKSIIYLMQQKEHGIHMLRQIYS